MKDIHHTSGKLARHAAKTLKLPDRSNIQRQRTRRGIIAETIAAAACRPRALFAGRVHRRIKALFSLMGFPPLKWIPSINIGLPPFVD